MKGKEWRDPTLLHMSDGKCYCWFIFDWFSQELKKSEMSNIPLQLGAASLQVFSRCFLLLRRVCVWNAQLGQMGGCSDMLDSFTLGCSNSSRRRCFTTFLLVAFSVTLNPPAANAGHDCYVLMDVKRVETQFLRSEGVFLHRHKHTHNNIL